MMKNLFLIIFVMFFGLSFAQLEDVQKEVKNGKVCYLHIVEGGNTLYGIHKLYNVPVEQIIAFNPGAEKGLDVGQIIYVPTDLSVTDTETKDYVIHTVEAKQTLYGISKKYNCAVDDIIKLNAGADQGIGVGQKLKIPRPTGYTNTVKPVTLQAIEEPQFEVTFTDSSICHEVQKGETLYSICRKYMVEVDEVVKINSIRRMKIKPGQKLQIPLKKETISEVVLKEVAPVAIDSNRVEIGFEKKSTYNVAVFLPLLLNKNEKAITGLATKKTELNPISNIALDMYLGIKKALDSLELKGLRANVQVYDTKRDTNTVKSILKDAAFKNTDIIIGPFFKNNISLIAAYCKRNSIRMIVPVPVEAKVLKNNPAVFAAVPSNLSMVKSLANFIVTKHGDDNVVLVKSGIEKDEANYRVFRDEFNRLTTESSYRGVLKEINLGSKSGSDLALSVVKDTLTVFVDLSTNVPHVMEFMTVLNKVKNKSGGFSKADIMAVGLKDWMNIKDLNSYYKNRFRLHYPAPNNLNYNTTAMKNFVVSFREQFGTDPSKYAVQGFDITYGYLAHFCLEEHFQRGLMNDIKSFPIGEYHGAENTTTFILKQQDFRIIEVGRVYDQRAN